MTMLWVPFVWGVFLGITATALVTLLTLFSKKHTCIWCGHQTTQQIIDTEFQRKQKEFRNKAAPTINTATRISHDFWNKK